MKYRVLMFSNLELCTKTGVAAQKLVSPLAQRERKAVWR
jgi:hypothetical protein